MGTKGLLGVLARTNETNIDRASMTSLSLVVHDMGEPVGLHWVTLDVIGA